MPHAPYPPSPAPVVRSPALDKIVADIAALPPVANNALRAALGGVVLAYEEGLAHD